MRRRPAIARALKSKLNHLTGFDVKRHWGSRSQWCVHGAHAIADINAGSLAAASRALAPLSCKRASLTESSGFMPRMIAVMLFNRHCESPARKPGLARQRAVLAMSLHVLAYNLKRMIAILGVQPLIQAIMA
jgi:hypothetical protein